MSAAPLRRLTESPWFTLAVLTLTFTVGFLDRQLLNLLVEPIKADLGLSDLEISMLQGIAFSGAYLLLSPVFGRWVDLSARRNILLGCVLVWSAFTGLCGVAGSFVALFVARSGVGAAEAGLTPACWSMLSDSFDRQRLPRAMSIYNMGPYLGSGLALLLGGLIIGSIEHLDVSAIPLLRDSRPWQLTFILVSTLGLICIGLLLLLREPPRTGVTGTAMAQAEADATKPTLREAVGGLLAERRFYATFYLGMALAIIPIYAFPAWFPAIAIRQFGIPLPQVGLEYGAITLLCGSAGVLSGPSLGAWLRRRGHRDAELRLGLFSAVAVFLSSAALLFRTDYAMLLIIGGVSSFVYSMPTALAASALQIVTPNRLRGLATSIYIVLVTLMGLGVAPVAVAYLTDRVFANEQAVGTSLALVCMAAAIGSLTMLALCLPAYRRLCARLDAARDVG